MSDVNKDTSKGSGNIKTYEISQKKTKKDKSNIDKLKEKLNK